MIWHEKHCITIRFAGWLCCPAKIATWCPSHFQSWVPCQLPFPDDRVLYWELPVKVQILFLFLIIYRVLVIWMTSLILHLLTGWQASCPSCDYIGPFFVLVILLFKYTGCQSAVLVPFFLTAVPESYKTLRTILKHIKLQMECVYWGFFCISFLILPQ